MRGIQGVLVAIVVAVGLISGVAHARGGGHSGSHGGHYSGGHGGSSHKGGSYKSAPTHDHYRHHAH